LNEALSWIYAALEKSTKGFRYGLLKAKIQGKKGYEKLAAITIEQAQVWAKAAKNANFPFIIVNEFVLTVIIIVLFLYIEIITSINISHKF